MDRPSWDAVWMHTAETVASRSLCSRAHVGAVIVTADNRVEAASYNGPPPHFPHGGHECVSWCPRATAASLDPGYFDCPASHAEANAIARSDWSALRGATIYVTGSVCFTCAKLILQTGIVKVVHQVLETDSHRMPDAVERFLRANNVIVERF